MPSNETYTIVWESPCNEVELRECVHTGDYRFYDRGELKPPVIPADTNSHELISYLILDITLKAEQIERIMSVVRR